MTYLTRCPACATVFRLREEHLAARQGYVRCGQCSKVFDARASLKEEPQPEAFDAPEAPHTLAPAPGVDHAPRQTEVPEVSAPEPTYSIADAPSDESYDFGPERRRRERIRAVGWGMGALLLLATLGLQAAWLFRADLAVEIPESRPWLDALCARVGCTVPPPRKVELLSIEASELQIDKNAPGLLTLALTLRNRAPYAQAHPALELTLTDAEERAIARRVLMPADYLGQRLAREPVFAAASEYALKLNLDTPALRTAGYRVYVFYP